MNYTRALLGRDSLAVRRMQNEGLLIRDVESHLYKTVIREMIRHENDVTNHRIMWLLIGQGLIANAYVSAGSEREGVVSVLAPVGILVTLSAFIILYKSYQARGYLQFLGNQAELGMLKSEDLPLMGWPRRRLKGWREQVWGCPWLGEASELLEPFFFLPALLVLAWLFLLLRPHVAIGKGILLGLCALITIVMLAAVCIIWTSQQARNELRPPVAREKTRNCSIGIAHTDDSNRPSEVSI